VSSPAEPPPLESTLKCIGGKGLHVSGAPAGKDKWTEVKTVRGASANEMNVIAALTTSNDDPSDREDICYDEESPF
jgi:hypothetical protein